MGTTKMKSILGWVMEFASTHKVYYVASVLLAICGVICSVIPFVLTGNIIRMLLAGEREWNSYLRLIVVIAALWILRVLFHSCSTTLSHKATFQVLANIRKNRKFQYKEVEHGGRAQKYYSSIEWLLRADLIQLCRLTTDVRYDLEDYARNDFFRAYTTDLSLLVAMRDFSLKQQIIENTIYGTTKGGIYECVVADIFLKKEKEMFFYKNDSAQKEVDFLIQTDGMVVPVEVKSGNTRATSLKWLKKRCPDISRMIKLADGNTGKSEEGIVTLPLYMAMFL